MAVSRRMGQTVHLERSHTVRIMQKDSGTFMCMKVPVFPVNDIQIPYRNSDLFHWRSKVASSSEPQAPYPVQWAYHIPQPSVPSPQAALVHGIFTGFRKRRGKLVILLSLMFLVAALMIVSMLLPWYTIDSYHERADSPYYDEVFNTSSVIFRFSGVREHIDLDCSNQGVMHHSSDEIRGHGWETYRGVQPGYELSYLYVGTEELLIAGLILMAPGMVFLLLRLAGRDCLLWGSLFFIVALTIDLIAILAFSGLHPMAYGDTFFAEEREVPAGPNVNFFGDVEENYTCNPTWDNGHYYPDSNPAHRSVRWGPGDGWYLAIAGILLFIPCAAILTHLARVDERGR